MADIRFEPDIDLEWAVGLNRQIQFTPDDRKGRLPLCTMLGLLALVYVVCRLQK